MDSCPGSSCSWCWQGMWVYIVLVSSWRTTCSELIGEGLGSNREMARECRGVQVGRPLCPASSFFSPIFEVVLWRQQALAWRAQERMWKQQAETPGLFLDFCSPKSSSLEDKANKSPDLDLEYTYKAESIASLQWFTETKLREKTNIRDVFWCKRQLWDTRHFFPMTCIFMNFSKSSPMHGFQIFLHQN